MSFWGPKAKKRTFDELVLSESVFQLYGGRTIALRRMHVDSAHAVYSALERAIDDAGDPKQIDGLVELAKMFCYAPMPSLYIRLRRLFGMSDFSARTLARRIIPMADRRAFEKWLIEENRDIDIKEYQEGKLNEVKKNLLFGFADELARIRREAENILSAEILDRLRSFFLREASEDSEAKAMASRQRNLGG